MRLIDADALLENYSLKDAVKYGNKTAEQQHNSYSTLMLYEVADMINDAPTIEAEPVRHGRWIYRVKQGNDGRLCVTIECSEGCEVEREIWHGYFIDVPDYIAERTALDYAKKVKVWPYCPNCGAKIDLEVEE